MSFMSQESGMSLSIPQKFRQSAQELKNVHTLTGFGAVGDERGHLLYGFGAHH